MIIRPWIFGVALFALSSTCGAAGFTPCKFSEASTIGHAQGITVRHVGVIEGDREIDATVFIPDAHEHFPGVLVTHSSIQGPASTVNLLRFAWALTRAGAASMVLNGTIEWQVPNDQSARDPHVIACAGQWLVIHANLDRHRLLLVGPQGRWGGGDTPFCQTGELPCFKPNANIGLGQTGVAESANTNLMLSPPSGALALARWAQKDLGLAEINPEWLTGISDEKDIPWMSK